jgi:hypothetical protein
MPVAGEANFTAAGAVEEDKDFTHFGLKREGGGLSIPAATLVRRRSSSMPLRPPGLASLAVCLSIMKCLHPHLHYLKKKADKF